MRAAAIFFLARVIRAAMAGSETRKALATSPVVSPHSRRSVSATRAPAASAGWQQVKIRRSRSSGIVSANVSSAPGPGTAAASASSGSLRDRVSLRWMRFIARRRATIVSHAAGLAGTPSAHATSAWA